MYTHLSTCIHIFLCTYYTYITYIHTYTHTCKAAGIHGQWRRAAHRNQIDVQACVLCVLSVLCVLCVVDVFSAIGGPRWRYITASVLCVLCVVDVGGAWQVLLVSSLSRWCASRRARMYAGVGWHECTCRLVTQEIAHTYITYIVMHAFTGILCDEGHVRIGDTIEKIDDTPCQGITQVFITCACVYFVYLKVCVYCCMYVCMYVCM